jgi:gliding motility-associated-like protein
VNITVNPNPIVTATANPNPICLGDNANLHASSNLTACSFNWDNGLGAGNNHIVSPTNTTTYTVTVISTNACETTADLTVVVNPNPTITINASANGVCEGEVVWFNVQSDIPGTAYLWNTGNNSNVVQYTMNTSSYYSVTGTSPSGCQDTDSIYITVYPNPIVNINPIDTSLCPNESVDLTAITNAQQALFLWNNGSVNQTINVSPAQTSQYTVTVTDQHGCDASSISNVTMRPEPTIIFKPDIAILCDGDSVTINLMGAVDYLWSPSTGLSVDTGSFVVASPNTSISYQVYATDQFGCTTIDSIPVQVNPLPDVKFSADINTGCENTVVNFINESSGINQYFYWDFGDPASGQNNTSTYPDPVHIYTSAGTYDVQLIVVSEHGCESDTMYPNFIEIYKNPIAMFTRTADMVNMDDPTVGVMNESIGAVSWEWDFGDPSSGSNNYCVNMDYVYHTYSEVGNYYIKLKAVSEHGCIDTTENHIVVLDTWNFYVPNAFSPNGDGINDKFYGIGTNIDETAYRMEIYDRWGKKVFETTDYKESWNGKVQGKDGEPQIGVYNYMISVRGMTGEERQYVGSVTLIQ